MCCVNQFVLIPDEEAFFRKQIHAQSCPLPNGTRAQEIISIFVSIVPFLVAHVQSDSDDFLNQNIVPFLNIFVPFPFLFPHYSHPRSVALSL